MQSITPLHSSNLNQAVREFDQNSPYNLQACLSSAQAMVPDKYSSDIAILQNAIAAIGGTPAQWESVIAFFMYLHSTPWIDLDRFGEASEATGLPFFDILRQEFGDDRINQLLLSKQVKAQEIIPILRKGLSSRFGGMVEVAQ